MTDRIPITHPEIHRYLERVRPPSDPILQEMERVAEVRHFPYLGPQCSRLLHALVKISGTKRIFELGSGFGYTMYWMALALPDDGLVIGTENDPNNANSAREYFRRGGLLQKTDMRTGDALSILRGEPGPFDLIVCDIDKHQYPEALALAKPRLRIGGILVADNLLWDGQVLNAATRDPETAAIREFTRLLYADPDFFTTIIPIRDGMSLSVKLGG